MSCCHVIVWLAFSVTKQYVCARARMRAAQWLSIASAAQKVVGSIPREHILTKNV